VQIPPGCNNAIATSKGTLKNFTIHSKALILNSLREGCTKYGFKMAIWGAFFFLYDGLLFHNDFHRILATNPYVSDGFRLKGRPTSAP
jgi:hypothetical protein